MCVQMCATINHEETWTCDGFSGFHSGGFEWPIVYHLVGYHGFSGGIFAAHSEGSLVATFLCAIDRVNLMCALRMRARLVYLRLWKCWALLRREFQDDFFRALGCINSNVFQGVFTARYKGQLAVSCIRTNLRDLLEVEKDSDRNGARNFWNWLNKQPWMQMLPPPRE